MTAAGPAEGPAPRPAMHTGPRLAVLLAAALLPGAAASGEFAPASLRESFTGDLPRFEGSALGGGELSKLKEAVDFVGSVAELDPDEQVSPFPGALGRADLAFLGGLWGARVAFEGIAVGRRTGDLFEGRIESLLAVSAWRQEQLTEKVRASLDLDVYTGARFAYRFAPSLAESSERWRTGGQLLAGVRWDFSDRLRAWARPGVRYQLLDVGDGDDPGTYFAGRLEGAWDGELVLPPRWPLWISVRAWVADDFTGRHLGARLELRPHPRLQLAWEEDTDWDEVQLSFWPWRIVETFLILHRDREYGTAIVALGGRLHFGGLSIPPFFSPGR